MLKDITFEYRDPYLNNGSRRDPRRSHSFLFPHHFNDFLLVIFNRIVKKTLATKRRRK